jgi:hypothetical protein
MNDIIFGTTYIIIVLYAVWEILKDRIKDKRNLIKNIIILIIVIVIGFYIPIHRNDERFITNKIRNIHKYTKFKSLIPSIL